ncbi:hypothetical protein C7H19_16565 [Aphanothece hegewaldii CCALA 016]|uniref:Fe2OG dioxygenase domain-containing protein n=1 Tax=Aphanothece hegewaldii CCALA 016 TaxID=2107694 RepID=A0A2T1LV50_9CHRO|nr:hypothetical protein [Aphanothece hegewaldii]PSF35395.1 hypothetical protein C7H19_16565 [Aphanothece hegewaldii CCALA 016]
MKTSKPSEAIVSLFKENLFIVNQQDQLPVAKILNCLQNNKFACLRGITTESEVIQARQAIQQKFSKNNDNPTIGESPEQVKTNFQKLSVGSIHSKHHTGSYARLLRTFYNALWNEDIYQMHELFRKMIRVRNQLLNKPINFAMNTIEDGLWTAARIHQYPKGGGFMQAHRDKTLTNIANQKDLNYFQLLLVMSQKGINYQQGGGFIEHNEQRICFEELCCLGDLIIYDSSTIHGVDDVDPHEVLDLDTLSGRMVAFVSLYKSL